MRQQLLDQLVALGGHLPWRKLTLGHHSAGTEVGGLVARRRKPNGKVIGPHLRLHMSDVQRLVAPLVRDAQRICEGLVVSYVASLVSDRFRISDVSGLDRD